MRVGRGGHSSWWQCVLLAAFFVPALACFREDGVDLGEGSSPEASPAVAVVKRVSTQPDVQIPVPASVTGEQGVISAGVARPTPSETAPVQTDRLRGRAGELRSLEHTYRAALLSLFTDSSSSFQLDQMARADMTSVEGAFSSQELFGDSNPFEEALASNKAERVAQAQGVVEEVTPAATVLMAPPPRLSLPFPAPKDFWLYPESLEAKEANTSPQPQK